MDDLEDGELPPSPMVEPHLDYWSSNESFLEIPTYSPRLRRRRRRSNKENSTDSQKKVRSSESRLASVVELPSRAMSPIRLKKERRIKRNKLDVRVKLSLKDEDLRETLFKSSKVEGRPIFDSIRKTYITDNIKLQQKVKKMKADKSFKIVKSALDNPRSHKNDSDTHAFQSMEVDNTTDEKLSKWTSSIVNKLTLPSTLYDEVSSDGHVTCEERSVSYWGKVKKISKKTVRFECERDFDSVEPLTPSPPPSPKVSKNQSSLLKSPRCKTPEHIPRRVQTSPIIKPSMHQSTMESSPPVSKIQLASPKNLPCKLPPLEVEDFSSLPKDVSIIELSPTSKIIPLASVTSSTEASPAKLHNLPSTAPTIQVSPAKKVNFSSKPSAINLPSTQKIHPSLSLKNHKNPLSSFPSKCNGVNGKSVLPSVNLKLSSRHKKSSIKRVHLPSKVPRPISYRKWPDMSKYRLIFEPSQPKTVYSNHREYYTYRRQAKLKRDQNLVKFPGDYQLIKLDINQNDTLTSKMLPSKSSNSSRIMDNVQYPYPSEKPLTDNYSYVSSSKTISSHVISSNANSLHISHSFETAVSYNETGLNNETFGGNMLRQDRHPYLNAFNKPIEDLLNASRELRNAGSLLKPATSQVIFPGVTLEANGDLISTSRALGNAAERRLDTHNPQTILETSGNMDCCNMSICSVESNYIQDGDLDKYSSPDSVECFEGHPRLPAVCDLASSSDVCIVPGNYYSRETLQQSYGYFSCTPSIGANTSQRKSLLQEVKILPPNSASNEMRSPVKDDTSSREPIVTSSNSVSPGAIMSPNKGDNGDMTKIDQLLETSVENQVANQNYDAKLQFSKDAFVDIGPKIAEGANCVKSPKAVVENRKLDSRFESTLDLCNKNNIEEAQTFNVEDDESKCGFVDTDDYRAADIVDPNCGADSFGTVAGRVGGLVDADRPNALVSYEISIEDSDDSNGLQICLSSDSSPEILTENLIEQKGNTLKRPPTSPTIKNDPLKKKKLHNLDDSNSPNDICKNCAGSIIEVSMENNASENVRCRLGLPVESNVLHRSGDVRQRLGKKCCECKVATDQSDKELLEPQEIGDANNEFEGRNLPAELPVLQRLGPKSLGNTFEDLIQNHVHKDTTDQTEIFEVQLLPSTISDQILLPPMQDNPQSADLRERIGSKSVPFVSGLIRTYDVETGLLVETDDQILEKHLPTEAEVLTTSQEDSVLPVTSNRTTRTMLDGNSCVKDKLGPKSIPFVSGLVHTYDIETGLLLETDGQILEKHFETEAKVENTSDKDSVMQVSGEHTTPTVLNGLSCVKDRLGPKPVSDVLVSLAPASVDKHNLPKRDMDTPEREDGEIFLSEIIRFQLSSPAISDTAFVPPGVKENPNTTILERLGPKPDLDSTVYGPLLPSNQSEKDKIVDGNAKPIKTTPVLYDKFSPSKTLTPAKHEPIAKRIFAPHLPGTETLTTQKEDANEKQMAFGPDLPSHLKKSQTGALVKGLIVVDKLKSDEKNHSIQRKDNDISKQACSNLKNNSGQTISSKQELNITGREILEAKSLDPKEIPLPPQSDIKSKTAEVKTKILHPSPSKNKSVSSLKNKSVSSPKKSLPSPPANDRPSGSLSDQAKIPKKSNIEFVSNYPDENKDNYAPGWAALRDVNSDSERYRAVRTRWRSLYIPDPNRNLTFRRQKLPLPERKRSIDSVAPSPMPCSFVYKTMVAKSKETFRRQLSTIAEEQNEEESHLGQQNVIQRQELNNHYEKKRRNVHYEFSNSCLMQHYKDYQREIKSFHNFYQDLDEDEEAMITSRQVSLVEDTERMYEEFKRIYTA